MKAIIFARVSSKDQEEGHSADAQTAKMQNYCIQKGLNVAKAYQVTESSTVGERKQFKQMLEHVGTVYKKDKKRVVLVIDKVDRLMRNFNYFPQINQMVENSEMEIHAIGENTVY